MCIFPPQDAAVCARVQPFWRPGTQRTMFFYLQVSIMIQSHSSWSHATFSGPSRLLDRRFRVLLFNSSMLNGRFCTFFPLKVSAIPLQPSPAPPVFGPSFPHPGCTKRASVPPHLATTILRGALQGTGWAQAGPRRGLLNFLPHLIYSWASLN